MNEHGNQAEWVMRLDLGGVRWVVAEDKGELKVVQCQGDGAREG